ncbi:glycosyltransferase [Winogradskyella alexanderae]|uniref:Glycosyltransferase n=1 Tax=Winogradskyella alexanderae TaxID=2877123 RepID=A0ABS7XU55_9FLAO|nr:glycosyltransferase [Winogradskyella alexanderae]MCA0132442.1 glycosyltransferase [Winogradskyella alexanderae]
MRIVHTIASIDETTGGPARSATQLVRGIVRKKEVSTVSLLTLSSPAPIITKFNNPKAKLVFNRANLIGYSKTLHQALIQSDANIFHGHGIWEMPVHQMAIYARNHHIPYIITPRGMLEPWSLQQGRFKKQLALKLYQYKDLNKASCIHATAKMEAQHIRDLGFTNPIAVIPNGVPLKELLLKTKPSQTKTLLFLSRIHPKKGLEMLIEGWAQLDSAIRVGWSVNIVGNGEPKYIEQLKQIINAKGLSETVKIKESLFGADKVKAYQEASLFVLPTYSENFGIVVAEALACGTPVITTQGTPWADLKENDCGWWIPIGVEPLKQTLQSALQLPNATLHQMGLRGRQLVEQKYSMEAVAEQMLQLYQWILNDTEPPEFVTFKP